MRTQESLTVDLDTVRLLEQFRLDLDEPREAILHRLLNNLHQDRCGLILLEEDRPAATLDAGPEGTAWEARGVRLPHGTKLRLVYKGKSYSGSVSNGRIKTNGEAFDTLSAAADKLTGVNLNGWIYWEALLGENWVKLSDLRKRR